MDFFLDVESRRFLSTRSFADGYLILGRILQTIEGTCFGNIPLSRLGMMHKRNRSARWCCSLLLRLQESSFISSLPAQKENQIIGTYEISIVFRVHNNDRWRVLWRRWWIIRRGRVIRRRSWWRCSNVVRLLLLLLVGRCARLIRSLPDTVSVGVDWTFAPRKLK